MPSRIKNLIFIFTTVILSFILATVLAEIAYGVIVRHLRHSIPDYPNTMRSQGLGPGGYLQENLTIYVTDGLGGKVRWTNNSMGFRSDREFSRQRPPGTLRILSLGDSFTAGYRVGQKQIFSYLQERWINRNFGRAEVLVAETEDSATSLYYLINFGIKMHPDVVLLGITLGNDIAQSYVSLDPKGSYSLDLAQGKVHLEARKNQQIGLAHGLEKYLLPPQYLKSFLPRLLGNADMWWNNRYLCRRFFPQAQAITSWGDRCPPNLFDACNGFGMYTYPAPAAIDEAYHRLFRILAAFQIYCQQKGMLLAVQVFPQRYQVHPDDWKKAVFQYGLNRARFDLMEPNKRIQGFCRKQGIICLDPTQAMAAYAARTGKKLYLPLGDMHWNQEGHRAFFECTKEALAAVVRQGFQVAQIKDSRAAN